MLTPQTAQTAGSTVAPVLTGPLKPQQLVQGDHGGLISVTIYPPGPGEYPISSTMLVTTSSQ